MKVAFFNLLREFWRHFKRLVPLYYSSYIIVIATMILAAIAGAKVGLAIDFSGIFGTLTIMAQVVSLLAAAVLAQQFLVVLFKKRSQTPTKDLIKILAPRLNDGEKLAKIAHMLIMFSFATIGFAVLKSSIALLNPFSWDLVFRDWDKAIHLGRLPHEWLGFIIDSPVLVFLLNIAYNIWFFLVFLSLYVFSSRYGDQREGLQFMNAFYLSWVVVGFLFATYFSSAGPCYFERLGLGTDYAGLMGDLDQANQRFSIWALETQNMLWDGQEGEREGRLGISAFPSMHIAIVVVMALGANAVSRFWGIVMWTYALLIFLGSVVLGWHYAVDGYASALIMLVIWKFSGWLADRSLQRAKNSSGV